MSRLRPGQLEVRPRWSGSVRAALAAALLVMATPAAGTDADAHSRLDPDFGDGGTLVTDVTGDREWAAAVVIQRDGKVVVGGTGQISNHGAFVLVRYHPDGSLDEDFGNSGVVVTRWSEDEGERYRTELRDLVLQPDGSLVAAGHTGLHNRIGFALARYRPDGTRDETFGTGGKVFTEVAPGEINLLSTLVLQADGKLIAAGGSDDTYRDAFAVVRYDPDGTLDETFGTHGRFDPDVPDSGDLENSVNDLAVGPDGKLVITDWSALFRFYPDGRRDETFGSGGVVVDDSMHLGAGLVVHPDGKITAAGVAVADGNIGDGSFLVARFLPDGRRDPSFGSHGRARSGAFSGWTGASDLVIQPDGKVVVVGTSTTEEGQPQFSLARHLPDGEVDHTFGRAYGRAGLVVTRFPAGARATAATLDADGRIVAVGTSGPEHYTSDSGSGDDFGLARYRGD